MKGDFNVQPKLGLTGLECEKFDHILSGGQIGNMDQKARYSVPKDISLGYNWSVSAHLWKTIFIVALFILTKN